MRNKGQGNLPAPRCTTHAHPEKPRQRWRGFCFLAALTSLRHGGRGRMGEGIWSVEGEIHPINGIKVIMIAHWRLWFAIFAITRPAHLYILISHQTRSSAPATAGCEDQGQLLIRQPRPAPLSIGTTGNRLWGYHPRNRQGQRYRASPLPPPYPVSLPAQSRRCSPRPQRRRASRTSAKGI